MDHILGGQRSLQKQGLNAERVTTRISGDVEKMRGLANTLTPMEIVAS